MSDPNRAHKWRCFVRYDYDTHSTLYCSDCSSVVALPTRTYLLLFVRSDVLFSLVQESIINGKGRKGWTKEKKQGNLQRGDEWGVRRIQYWNAKKSGQYIWQMKCRWFFSSTLHSTSQKEASISFFLDFFPLTVLVVSRGVETSFWSCRVRMGRIWNCRAHFLHRPPRKTSRHPSYAEAVSCWFVACTFQFP